MVSSIRSNVVIAQHLDVLGRDDLHLTLYVAANAGGYNHGSVSCTGV